MVFTWAESFLGWDANKMQWSLFSEKLSNTHANKNICSQFWKVCRGLRSAMNHLGIDPWP